MGDRTPEQVRESINQLVARFGEERDLQLEPLNEDGLTSVQRGSAVVWIQCLPEQGVLLLLSKVLKVPEKNREALYRKLLELSFLATGDAAFAIDAGSNTVYLRALRQLDGLDYDEFEDMVHTVASVADEWDDKLVGEFGE
jgi:hypothetical protein